ncbi:COG1470 family protein [Streptosporangium roseum]|uniref:COG1470 family protein n=1 Tax=Streptosporangium roseum TaxID=2001 RepID=UPI003332490D
MTLLAALCSGAAGSPAGASGQGVEDAHGKIGIRLLEAPVSRRDDPRARSYIVDHLSPGTTIRRRLEISNTSGDAQRIDLYPAGADIVRNRFTMARGRTPNELTGWVALDRSSLDLPPGGRGTARVTIEVPPAASRGERYGVVWAQAVAEADAAHPVRVVSRVGIRLYLDIGRGGEPPSDFRIEELTPVRAPDGRPQLAALVHNTGARALDMSGSLSLSDGPGGLSAGPFAADLGVTLAPGAAAPVTMTLDRRIPDGPWKVELTLMSGMVKRTVSATVTFPRAGAGLPVPPDSGLLSLFGVLGGLVALLVAVAVLAVRLRRRRATAG